VKLTVAGTVDRPDGRPKMSVPETGPPVGAAKNVMPLALEMEAGSAVFYESAPAGRTTYLLTYLDRTDVRQV